MQAISEQLVFVHNFAFCKSRDDLQDNGNLGGLILIVLLKVYFFINDLQFLDPFNLNDLNLLKSRGIKSIVGSDILIKLYYINEKIFGVKFTQAGVIGPKLKKIKGYKRNK